MTAWNDFTKKIFEILGIRTKVIAITTAEFTTLAKRPKFSAMDSGKVMRSWEASLNDYLCTKA